MCKVKGLYAEWLERSSRGGEGYGKPGQNSMGSCCTTARMQLLLLLLVPASPVVWLPVSVLPPPLTPCPHTFQYLQGDSGMWTGMISVQPSQGTMSVSLRVELYIKGRLPLDYKAEVNPVERKEVLLRRLAAGDQAHIKYRLSFMPALPTPLIHRIVVNDVVVCEGPGDIYLHLMRGQVVSEYQTAHTLGAAQHNTHQPAAATILPAVRDVTCGQMGAAIPLVMHGQLTMKAKWPWHAALYMRGVYLCGAVLVSPSTVLTVAHCITRYGEPVNAEDLSVSLGRFYLSQHSVTVQDRKVSDIHVHPSFNSTNFHADLAVLIMDKPVHLTLDVAPACLFNTDKDMNMLRNVNGFVVGWGMDENGKGTDDLRLAEMPIVSQETCLRSYPEFFGRFTDDRTYCAGYRNGTSPCNGDSGGGMVVPITTDGSVRWFLRGLVSLSVSRVIDSRRMCDPGHFIVFTDIIKYHDWIIKYMK